MLLNKYQILFLLLFFVEKVRSLKCFHCNINYQDAKLEISCDKPTQMHCENLDDSCLSVIYNNTIRKSCLPADTGNNNKTTLFLKICNETKRINSDNCKICATDLCNSYKTNFMCATASFLVYMFFFQVLF